jgi:PKD repeat protein
VQNPDLFVKIWFDRSGRVDVNFFHVSVPDIEVYSDYPYNGTSDEHGVATVNTRYIRHYYENGRSGVSEQYEDGLPASGYLPANLPSGVMTVNDLKFASVINTVEKGGIEAVWQLGGQSTTARGDQVVWGYFYADPSDVTWGDKANPDLFVKIWYDVSGRIDVNFFHVSVPDIEVYSDCVRNVIYDKKGTTILSNRYIRHEYYGMCAPDIDPSNPSPAVAEFDVSTAAGEAPLTVSFSDKSSNAVSRLWDFGDGEIPQNRMQPSPVHTYMRAGTYTVKLFVNGAGGSDSETATITVTDPAGGSGGW